MEVNQPPFTLQKIELLEITFRRNETYNAAEHIQNSLKINISRRTEQPILSVSLEVDVWQEHEGDRLMDARIVMNGQFLVADGVDQQFLENFADINAPAILYPFVREVIASLTARAGIPTVLVQPLNFVDMQRRKQEQSKTVTTDGTDQDEKAVIDAEE